MDKSRIVILVARGIGERLDQNIAMHVAYNARDDIYTVSTPVKVTVKELRWPAEYGPFPKPHSKVSFNDSLETLHSMLNLEVFDDGHTMYFLVGYSGGAAGIGDWLAQASQKQKDLVLGSVLIADPSTPKGIIPNDPILGEPRFGIRGDRPIDHHTVKWICNPDDVICSCPENSPLRLIASATPNAALADMASWGTVLNQMAIRQASQIARGQFTNMMNKKSAQEQVDAIRKQFDVAFRDAYGYIAGDDHVAYTVRGDKKFHPTWSETASNFISLKVLNTFRR
ncbi:lysin B [Gordonia phage Lambo]|uniref:Lysin B n=1 Tax=Gordonia phage Lambo TaxID=2599845 RepID=A0A5J6TYY1_9CAUD|nr:lysin B [Gordonia phage Lambo]QFG13592.1 lysin B [Gordonia phage Lambo]